jgi:hypothetical protein
MVRVSIDIRDEVAYFAVVVQNTLGTPFFEGRVISPALLRNTSNISGYRGEARLRQHNFY